MSNQYKNRILLSVMGGSPAVVTETLYALVKDKNFIPTQIKVITTEFGKNKALIDLLGIDKEGRKVKDGALNKFIKDYGSEYGFDHIQFTKDDIILIENDDEQLEDIRTKQDNELAADQIVSIVGELCKSDDTALHVSIAGGRKTMGFFLGYALSLYGREQDSLSHVLVDQNFEQLNGFYYPTPYKHEITKKPYIPKPQEDKVFDAQEAKVELAEIPWVRLNLGIPENRNEQGFSFSDAVKKAQSWVDSNYSIKFHVNIDKRYVTFGNKKVKLSAKSYAFLLSVIIAKEQGWIFSMYDVDDERTLKTYFEIWYHVGNVTPVFQLHFDHYLNEDGEFKIEDKREARQKIVTAFGGARNSLMNKLAKDFSISTKTAAIYVPNAGNAGKESESVFSLDSRISNIDLSEIKKELKNNIDIEI